MGTGSVQTGGSDQSLYTQVIKSFDLSKIFKLQLSAGVATLLPDFDELYGLASITTSLNDRITLFANYDGKSLHEGLSLTQFKLFTISFLLIESETPAFSIAFRI